MGRVTAGVRGINLRKGDFVEEVAIFDPRGRTTFWSSPISASASGRRSRSSGSSGRGGYGVDPDQAHRKERQSSSAMHHVHEDDQVLMVTEGGMLIRMNVGEIRRIGRATQGVRVIRLDDGDRVVSVAGPRREDEAKTTDDGSRRRARRRTTTKPRSPRSRRREHRRRLMPTRLTGHRGAVDGRAEDDPSADDPGGRC